MINAVKRQRCEKLVQHVLELGELKEFPIRNHLLERDCRHMQQTCHEGGFPPSITVENSKYTLQTLIVITSWLQKHLTCVKVL